MVQEPGDAENVMRAKAYVLLNLSASYTDRLPA